MCSMFTCPFKCMLLRITPSSDLALSVVRSSDVFHPTLKHVYILVDDIMWAKTRI
jgi:hypothetical protein